MGLAGTHCTLGAGQDIDSRVEGKPSGKVW